MFATRVEAKDPRALPGWSLYDRLCLACHGAQGDGRGPAAPFTWGRPRVFTSGQYEWRSTAIGQPPTDDDLRTAIAFGARGTSMPGFADTLDRARIDQLIEVVKAFAPSSFAVTAKPVSVGALRPPNGTRGAQLWTQLGCDRCHGERGKGDGPAAKGLAEPPYDLTEDPLRRPRESDTTDARRRAAATSIATGMTGTTMPGYLGQISSDDLWALADHVVALGARAARRDRSSIDADEIEADRITPQPTGTWPGTDRDDALLFGGSIAPQGPPPASLAPAEASLSVLQCGRCHIKQYREWQTSLHSGAASPGLLAQIDTGTTEDATGDNCRRCHTPLAEQQPGAIFDVALRDEGVTCASCHVRAWTRHGPPRDGSVLSRPGYPLVEQAIYERSDMCMACHQLPARGALNGKPLLNTYKEWLEGPYMRRGIECQHCHMSGRTHQWLGVHDRDTFRQGMRLAASAHRANTGVTVVAELTNIGAGHYLPTTPTPAAWVRIQLIDAHGVAIEGALAEQRIGRDIYWDGKWHERGDTRIPPGETRTVARAWTGGRTGEAVLARITVEVHPDDYYEGFYVTHLRDKLVPAIRARYEQALARARSTHYIAEQRDVALSSQP